MAENKTDLFTVYKKILVNLGCEILEDGHVTIGGNNLMVDVNRPNPKADERDQPETIIDRLPVVLPTEKILANPDQKNHVYFHPMGESIFRGNSEILNLVILLARIRVKVELVGILKLLLRMGQDTGKHGKLNQALIEDYIAPIGVVSSTSAKAIETLIDKLSVSKDGSIFQSLMALNVKRSEAGRPEAYWRVNFDPENPPELTKLPTKTAAANWAALMEILPKELTHASAEDYAPAFHSLLMVLNKLFSAFDVIAKDVKRYEVYSTDYQQVTTDDWDVLCHAYKKRYNMQLIGNIGVGGNADDDVEELDGDVKAERVSRKVDDALMSELTRPAPKRTVREEPEVRRVDDESENPLAAALQSRPRQRERDRVHRRDREYEPDVRTEYRDPRSRDARRDDRDYYDDRPSRPRRDDRDYYDDRNYRDSRRPRRDDRSYYDDRPSRSRRDDQVFYDPRTGARHQRYR